MLKIGRVKSIDYCFKCLVRLMARGVDSGDLGEVGELPNRCGEVVTVVVLRGDSAKLVWRKGGGANRGGECYAGISGGLPFEIAVILGMACRVPAEVGSGEKFSAKFTSSEQGAGFYGFPQWAQRRYRFFLTPNPSP